MSYNGLLFSLVGVTRLELATSRPPDAYSNQLSYTPLKYCVRDEIRTHTAFRPLPPQSSVSTNSTTRTFADIIDARLRAKNGTRTRDPDLGKVVLYQLSYFRRCCIDSDGDCGIGSCIMPATLIKCSLLSEKRDSNPRPRPWQGRALPTELFSRFARRFCRLRCKGRYYF